MATEDTRGVVAVKPGVEDHRLAVVGVLRLLADAERICLDVVEVVELDGVGVGTNTGLREYALPFIDVSVEAGLQSAVFGRQDARCFLGLGARAEEDTGQSVALFPGVVDSGDVDSSQLAIALSTES